MSIAIALRQILAADHCYDPRDRGLLPADHDLDAPISFREIVEKAGAEDAIWCFSILPDHDNLKRRFAVDCAERVKHLMADERSLNALTVARRHAMGQATDKELDEAWYAAEAASDDGVWTEVADAAQAAALAAVESDTRDAAEAAAWAAAGAAVGVGGEAENEAENAAWNAAYDSEQAWQAARLIELTETGEWSPVAE